MSGASAGGGAGASKSGADQAKELLKAAMFDNGAEGQLARAKLAGVHAMGEAVVEEFSAFFTGTSSADADEDLNVIDAADGDAGDGFGAEDMLAAPVHAVVEELRHENGHDEIGVVHAMQEDGLVMVVFIPADADRSGVRELAQVIREIAEEEL